MSNALKKMIMGSMIASGLVALAAILDIFFAVPFAGRMVMDIMFLVGAGAVIYMGYDAYQDLS